MARIRSIKPEFWTSEQVMACDPATRLLFIGMWNFADDYGRMPFAPGTIKAQVLPGDAIPIEQVREMILRLSTLGLVLIYAVEGREYLEITGWAHQKIDKPHKPKHPAPFVEQKETFAEPSPKPPRTFVAGEDRIGEDTKKEDDDEETREPLVTEESNRLSDEIATIVGHDLHFVPPAWCGASYTVQKWLSNGWRREIILASVREQMQRRRGDKPDKIIYFEKGIAAAHARHAAPLPTAKIIEGETVNVHAKPESAGNIIAAQDRLVARIADFNKPPPKLGDGGIRSGEGADVVRLLPER
jgi:hypothetical protein